MADIFISYAREDQRYARGLSVALENQGWSVWWDPKLRAGERFDDVIDGALKEAKCIIVIWSRHSVESAYVKDEATYALDHDKLVPLAVEEVVLPFRFERIHTPKLVDWDGSEANEAFRHLVNDITEIIGSPSVAEESREAKVQVELEQQVLSDRLKEKEVALKQAVEAESKWKIDEKQAKQAEGEARRKAIQKKTIARGVAFIGAVFIVVVFVKMYQLPPASPPKLVGLSQTEWQEVQQPLNDLGFDAGAVDGFSDPKT